LTRDDEANRLSARASRYARLGVNAGALAARVGVNRLRGGGRDTDARALASLLGSMKGPMMKVAQLLSTIPDALPADYANELIRRWALASCAAACRPSSGPGGANAFPSSI
jgi:predicted unusual protein kinase regulating ubiquinone biosynthesis (AarF/ABC1/UbiB family)